MPDKLEKDIQREICEYLDNAGYLFWRSNNIPVFGRNNGGKMTFRALPRFTPRGLPDIMIIHAGNFIAVEVKRGEAKLRPEQKDFKEKLERNGAEYIQSNSLENFILSLAEVIVRIDNTL